MVLFSFDDRRKNIQKLRLQGKHFLSEISQDEKRYGISLGVKYEHVPTTKDFNTQKKLKISHTKRVEKKYMNIVNDTNFNKIFSVQDTLADSLNALTHSELLVYEIKGEDQKLSITLPSSNKSYRLLVYANKGSSATVIIDGLTENKISTSIVSSIFVIAEENAKVNVLTLHGLSIQKDIFEKKAFVYVNASVDWYTLSIGSQLRIGQTINELRGYNAQATATTIVCPERNATIDEYHASMHQNAYTKSNLSIRSIATEHTQSIQRGLVHISKDAPNSDGFQQIDQLIIDPTAKANAIPELQINNNNVKCSHGSTVGRINEEQLFYLTSRGLSKYQATLLVLRGFIQPLIEKFPETEFSELSTSTIEKWMDVM